MQRGLYTAAVGMTTQMNKMDVVSNNIANVNTTGYKKDEVVTRSFDEEMMLRLHGEDRDTLGSRNIGTMNMGVTLDNIYTDFTSGSVQLTGNPFDLCLDGDGFFKVVVTDDEGNQEVRYTRDGSFNLTPNNEVVTSDGYYVLGESGNPINLGPDANSFSVDANGNVYVDEQLIDKFDIVSFEDNEYLRKQGENLYYTVDGAVETSSSANVLQGYVEGSNVNPVKEMVEMITVSRVYEANQKVVGTYDQLMSKSANEIGRR